MKFFITLDVGKTLIKLTLWRQDGFIVAQEKKKNQSIKAEHYAALDIKSTQKWLLDILVKFGALKEISAIIPVAHGAGVAILEDDKLAILPIDYEYIIPEKYIETYKEDRDSFKNTGSPLLSGGLNIGLQLHFLENLYPKLFEGNIEIIPLAQYWAWFLSGKAASEVTSLGCHTDLWNPMAATLSVLADKRGWSSKIAPLYNANDILGTLRPEIATETGLPLDTHIYCGLHDSNAALLSARANDEIENTEATVLSTGTWFIAMRSPQSVFSIDELDLTYNMDCLINVDAYGKLIPSSRYMGGREIETLVEIPTHRLDIEEDQVEIMSNVENVLRNDIFILPSFSSGSGPFPDLKGRWINKPDSPYVKRAAISLYAAMMSNKILDLIGSQNNILIEGRFSKAQTFVKALAALRPNDNIFIGNLHNDVSYGALRLLEPSLKADTPLQKVSPLHDNIIDYMHKWNSIRKD